MQQCIVRAIEKSFDIKILQNEEQIAANNYTRANAGYTPIITGNAAVNGEALQVPVAHGEQYVANIGATWNVFDGFKKQATYEWLYEMKIKGELTTRLAIETLVAEITTMYYDLVQRNIRARNLQESIGLSRHRLRIAKEKFLLGACSRLEVLQAEVDFNADSSAYVIYLDGTRQLKIRFKQRLQIPYLHQIEVADAGIALNKNLEIGDLHERVLVQNISLQIYDKNRVLSDLERQQVEAARRPYINLNGNYGYSGTPYDKPNELGLSYSATLGIKLFDWGNQQRMEKNAKLQEMNRELEYRKQELQVLTDLGTLYATYKNYLNLLDLETLNSKLAAEKADLALEQYQMGQLSSLEMREFQRTLLDAQNRLANAQYQVKYSEINLLQLCAMTSSYLEDNKNNSITNHRDAK
ncbi:membrane protein [Bacteroidia bacterium]|nr:membrane protein [Bacteroidia bacterium]